MTVKRLILEMGTGNDLYGEDYTKAAVRAVQDALHHSSLTLFRSLKLEHDAMQVTVNIGVQKPECVDVDKVKQQIPFGTVTVVAVKGGLNIPDPENDILSVVATAGVEAHLDIPDGKFKLADS
ncbi:Lin0512 family protein [Pelagibius sp. Alg239-R121]|uniref:Lin0512 family protein n=1 Tax=Pelagibius sp. Alg239-R121 TaxID=2993448 RepID=UPI0024A7916C|nr:Lin0512 family protein [Pelagibius sp. Alg239-R121]